MREASLTERDLFHIQRIGADGDGIARSAADGAVYIPLTLPAEAVRARLLGRRGEGRVGVLEVIEHPSPDRIMPACRHFGACGGCALQHWRPEAYATWKSGLLAAALRRAGFADVTLAQLAISPPGSRRRVDLALRRVRGGVVLGLHRARSAEIVDLAECAVLHPALVGLLAPLRAILPGLAGLRREGSAVLNLLDEGPDLLLRTDAELGAADRASLAGLARAHGLPRISWAHGGGAPEPVATLRPARTTLSGVPVVPPPGAFLQATAEGEAAIIAAVLAGLPAKLPARARIAELYAGCGTLSFALARHARVMALEGDPAAVAALTEATRRAGLDGRITVARQDLARRPLLAAELAPFSAVVLDPPYGGAVEQVAQIAASAIRCVIYISCNPAALARDAAVLRQAGFAVTAATPIDQFLWSARLESVVVFARGR